MMYIGRATFTIRFTHGFSCFFVVTISPDDYSVQLMAVLPLDSKYSLIFEKCLHPKSLDMQIKGRQISKLNV